METAFSIWAVVFGNVALVFYVAMYLFQNPRKTLLMEVGGDGFALLHYLVLGSLTSGLVILLTIFRMLGSVYISDKWLRPMLFGYIALIWLITAFTLQTPVELFGVTGCTCAALAALWRDNWLPFRIGLLACYSFWLMQGIYMSTPAIILSYVMVLSSNAITLLYFMDVLRIRPLAPLAWADVR